MNSIELESVAEALSQNDDKEVFAESSAFKAKILFTDDIERVTLHPEKIPYFLFHKALREELSWNDAEGISQNTISLLYLHGAAFKDRGFVLSPAQADRLSAFIPAVEEIGDRVAARNVPEWVRKDTQTIVEAQVGFVEEVISDYVELERAPGGVYKDLLRLGEDYLLRRNGLPNFEMFREAYDTVAALIDEDLPGVTNWFETIRLFVLACQSEKYDLSLDSLIARRNKINQALTSINN